GRWGAWLQQSAAVTLGANDYGTTTVHVASANPGVALVSPRVNAPGVAAFDTVLTAPNNQFFYYVQGVEGASDTTSITATATGFVTGKNLATIVAPTVALLGVPTTTRTLTPNSPFFVLIG